MIKLLLRSYRKPGKHGEQYGYFVCECVLRNAFLIYGSLGEELPSQTENDETVRVFRNLAGVARLGRVTRQYYMMRERQTIQGPHHTVLPLLHSPPQMTFLLTYSTLLLTVCLADITFLFLFRTLSLSSLLPMARECFLCSLVVVVCFAYSSPARVSFRSQRNRGK